MRATCLALLLCSAQLHATDIHVPGDAPSISSAVALAQSGDTILVAPGTWVGPVVVAGKSVRIVATGGPAVTTIDGGASDTAVLLSGAAPGSAELESFTITGGSLARVTLPAGNATLRRCRVLDGAGPGVLASGSGSKLLQDCLVSGNSGGGVRSSLTGPADVVTVQGCAVEENGSPDVDFGGGLYGTAIAALDSVVSGNTAQRGGGGAFLRSQQGTLFAGNTATISGGGYYAQGLGTSNNISVKGAVIVGNHAPLCGGVHLDLSTFFTPGHLLERCLVADNTDDGGNLGLLSRPLASTGSNITSVVHCTFANNRVVGDQTLLISSSIVRGPPPSISTGGNTVAQFSDIEGGWPGTGTFDADPLFVDAPHGVYALTPGSPCKDAGPALAPPDPDGSIEDIGVATLAPLVGAGRPHFGTLGLPALSGTGTLEPLTPVTLSLVRARPFAGATLVLGIPGLFAPFKGGVFVPDPLFVIPGLPVDGTGALTLGGTWPAGLPSGLVAWAQCWIPDAAASQGFAASNGLGFVAP